MPNPIDLQKYLKGVDYPITKDQLIKKAQENGAGNEIIEFIKRIASDHFQSPVDITKALGEMK